MQKLEFFQNLGFNEYESKTLSSLSEISQATPKQLSLSSKVPQNKLYQIIKKFQSLGILSEIPNEKKEYKLINLNTFIRDRLKENESKLKILKKASINLDKLKTKQENFNFSIILGQQSIMNHLAEKNKEVKQEILGVQRNWKVWAEGLREMQKSAKQGVRIKIIGVINKETIKRAKEWKEIGCKIKAYNNKFGKYPLRFSIFDNKYARITIGKPEIQNPKDYITICTDSKPLIAMLRNQFAQMWKECENF